MTLQKSTRRVAKDAEILVEGRPSDHEILFLTRGTAVVEIGASVVGTIRAGEWFGEVAAILGTPRTATVRAVTPCEVLVFKGVDDANLYEAMTRDPRMMRKLVEQICLRLIEISKRHSSEAGDLTEQAVRYRRAISGTLYALEKLVDTYKSKVMEETREHLAALSGVPVGQAADADPKFFPSSRAAIFGA